MTPSDFLDSLDVAVDPANSAPYPRGLALDLVLEVGPLKEILDSYDISPENFRKILANHAFRTEYEKLKEEMQTEGWSFRKKAASQAELYLNLVYRLASSDQTPAAVRASLIQSTVKWAGLDTPAPVIRNDNTDMLAEAARQLKDMPDGELELKVLSLIMRKSPPANTAPAPQLGETYDHD